MAQFRATIEGQRGSASRLGSKNSGITAHVNGWWSGVRVEGLVRGENGNASDVFNIYATGGSNARFSDKYVAEIRVTSQGIEIDYGKR